MWTLAPHEAVTAASTSFTAWVSRLGCSNGVTGKVLRPAVDFGKSRVVVTFEVEPLPEASPLWRHPRVTISPHNSAISTPDTILRAVVDQIAAHERGEKLRNVVDRKRGY